MRKNYQLILILVLSIFLISACGVEPDDEIETVLPENTINSYTVSYNEVEEADFSAIKMDLNFLDNMNQTVERYLWIDEENIVIITSDDNANYQDDYTDSESENYNNITKIAYIYILNPRTNTLMEVYNGELLMGKLILLDSGEVAIYAYNYITIFNPKTGEIVDEIITPADTYPIISPVNKNVTYIDENNDLIVLNYQDDSIKTYTAEQFTSNWISSPAWSNEGEYIAIFTSYSEYSFGNIAILNTQTGEITTLDYEDSFDTYPHWPEVGDGLVTYNNFVISKEDNPARLDVINSETGEVVRSITPDSANMITYIYTDIDSNIYFACVDGGLQITLFGISKIVSSDGVYSAADNTIISPNANKAAIFDKYGYVYIINM